MRRILIIGLVLAAMVPLAKFVLQSRPVPVAVHDAHLAAIADLERTAEDYSALTTTLSSAWTSGQDPGQDARALAARITESPERLSGLLFGAGGGRQEGPIRDRYDAYTLIVSQTEPLLAELFEEQAIYLESVAFVRASGPGITQQMRRLRLDRAAAETSQLVAGTLDYATAEPTVEAVELRRLLVSLGRDLRIDANMPNQAQRLLDSVTVVLENKSIIQSNMTQVVLMPIPDNVHSLIRAEQEFFSSRSITTGEGRALLFYAALLLVTAGFVSSRRRRRGYR
ncbi:MAG: hypothetical protein V3S67_06765 [Gammaproteobacteria bacterium]